jgi:hypothetical protein
MQKVQSNLIDSYTRDISSKFNYLIMVNQSATPLAREQHITDLGIAVDEKLNFRLCLHEQAQKRPKVFGCAQIISLLNTEQNHLTRLPRELPNRHVVCVRCGS